MSQKAAPQQAGEIHMSQLAAQQTAPALVAALGCLGVAYVQAFDQHQHCLQPALRQCASFSPSSMTVPAQCQRENKPNSKSDAHFSMIRESKHI
jgi:hypothetical protein